MLPALVAAVLVASLGTTAPDPVPIRPDASVLAISATGRFVALRVVDGVRVWDRRTGTSVRVRGSGGSAEVGFGGMTSDGRFVLVNQTGRAVAQTRLGLWD